MTIDPDLAERLEAALRRRAASWAATDAHMRGIFDDDWHSTKTFPVELAELSAEELAELTVNVLWPPAPASPEEREAMARAARQRIYAEVTGEQPGAANADD